MDNNQKAQELQVLDYVLQVMNPEQKRELQEASKDPDKLMLLEHIVRKLDSDQMHRLLLKAGDHEAIEVIRYFTDSHYERVAETLQLGALLARKYEPILLSETPADSIPLLERIQALRERSNTTKQEIGHKLGV